MKNIVELAKSLPEINVTIKLEDLLTAVNYCVNTVQEKLEINTSKENDKKYVSITECGKILGVDKSTLWRWAKNGYLVPISVGGKRVYSMSDIKKILEGGR
ncbi:helix-turn-helix domain-containing protein [Parabacteroides sp. Marseille-P3160]|uniref:helix-turn-helix domain-containing protein n=1 Tax=Parabacteroides sp. Marseille-P3160 TaxID=1917887 RepID=UPI0009BC5B62|nr:helix-turn-helix domain-containing protein [Parabacteroides sp. Marseille-P3160]